MRVFLLMILIAVPACTPLQGVGAAVGVEAASVILFGRGFVDLGVSAVSGRDCSIVRLDRRQTYCAPRDVPPDPGPFCTRSLGTADCWSDPSVLPKGTQAIADTPAPNAAQLEYRRARWPKSLFAL